LGETSKLVAAANPMAKYAAQLQAQASTREVLLRAAAAAAPTHRLLAARPLAAYERLLDQLTSPLGLAGVEDHERDDPGSVGLLHGHAVDGLVARDALFRPPSGERLEDLLDVVEARVIEPWRSARDRVGEYLHSALSAVDPKLAELFCGAWETLERQGAGYVEATCHLILETLQRALRALAPDDDVVAWAAEQRIPEKEVKSDGRVTRRARLRCLFFTGSKGERKLVVAEIESIDKAVEALVGRLNAGKHASEADVAVCRAHLCSVEAVLLRLFRRARMTSDTSEVLLGLGACLGGGLRSQLGLDLRCRLASAAYSALISSARSWWCSSIDRQARESSNPSRSASRSSTKSMLSWVVPRLPGIA